MEISMWGLTPPSPPPMMEIFFSILLDIRPFFENTLKNFHFALWNAQNGSKIPTKNNNFRGGMKIFSILGGGVKPDMKISITALTLCSLDFEIVEVKFKTMVW